MKSSILSSTSTSLSTSDKLHIAVEERLIQAAIEQAFENADADVVKKKAYQARYEVTAFDGFELPTQDELQYGPTVITTRGNYFLENGNEDDGGFGNWWTMGDFLDADQDGTPDILPSLVTFRDTNNPAAYLQQVRNRGITVDDGTIELINLITLDGRFSATNSLISTCFSATNEDEFVFETLVGVANGQNRILTANPEQTEQILLAGSTAIDPASPREPVSETEKNNANGPQLNKFIDQENGEFVDFLEVPLFINLVPDLLIPGDDTIVQQATAFITPCQGFSYFA